MNLYLDRNKVDQKKLKLVEEEKERKKEESEISLLVYLTGYGKERKKVA
jgi:hypothetical protein